MSATRHFVICFASIQGDVIVKKTRRGIRQGMKSWLLKVLKTLANSRELVLVLFEMKVSLKDSPLD